MNDTNEILKALDVIANLSCDDTLDSSTGQPQNRTYWTTSLYRTITGDSRVKVCAYLEWLIHHTIALIKANEAPSQTLLYLEMVPAVQNGLRQLMRNYDDMGVSERIRPLILALDKARPLSVQHPHHQHAVSSPITYIVVDGDTCRLSPIDARIAYLA